MTEPQDDQPDTVGAARRESEQRHAQQHEPPPGSWRAKLRNYEADTAVMEWDGEEWDIPAKMPNAYFEASQRGDARALVEAVIGIEGVVRLRIPRDVDAETMGDLALDISEAAGRVWDVPNLNRSARRSRSTTRR